MLNIWSCTVLNVDNLERKDKYQSIIYDIVHQIDCLLSII
jgi:hypothetical protein